MEICIVIPAYNEEACIESVVTSWAAELSSRNLRGALIVVNDGSQDRTGEILDRLSKQDSRIRVLLQRNRGHGAALVAGYHEAVRNGAAWVFQVDSDAQFEPRDFYALWERREASRFILGYRQERQDTSDRILIARLLRLLLMLLFGVRLKDPNVPFRLMKADYLAALLRRIPLDVFAPNLFLAVLAARDGQDLGFIPVTHLGRKTGKASLLRWGLVKACVRNFREVVKFRLHLYSVKAPS